MPAPEVGVFHPKRSVLAVGSVVSIGLLASLSMLPAYADAFAVPQEATPVQTFAATGTVQSAVIERDGFGVTTFTLVQYPVPTGTTVSSGFGLRVCNGCDTNHTGTDFNPGNGHPIQSIADGMVVEVSFDAGGYGQHVVVEHVIDGQIVRSLYAHMQAGSPPVAVGDVVLRGQQLGLVGQTGQATGPHLHFEIIIDGTKIDPYPWLVAHVNS